MSIKLLRSFPQALNRSLITLKKVLLGCQGAASLEIEADRLYLAEVADAVAALLNPAPGHTVSEATARVPGSLSGHLRVERGGDFDDFIADLRQASDRLRHRAQDLNAHDIAILEKVAEIADAETTRVFRGLIRM